MLIAWALQVARGAPSATIANRLSACGLANPLRATPSRNAYSPFRTFSAWWRAIDDTSW